MTDTGDDTNSPPHRRIFEASGDDIEVRQDEESVFELRMPIASTGEVRNQGDDPLTRDEVDGMVRQINDGSLTVGVFVDHGQTNISGAARYSIAERVGEWQDAEVTTRDDRDAELLEATARMMDPDSLPDIPVRGHLGTVKELAVRDMSVPASIGWADDEDAPGGVDLMEASVVGIQADKRTHSEASGGQAVARAAVAAGADPDALVAQVRQVVEHGRPLGPPGNPDRFDTFEECVNALADDPDLSREDAERICGAWEQAKADADRNVVEVAGEDVDLTPPEAMVTAAELAREKKQELDAVSDCGTGVGADTARAVVNDELTASGVIDQAAYLTSHEEDVQGITDPPSSWSDEMWEGRTTGDSDDARCGPVQYALWGGTATGTGLEWAQGKANEVAEARDEELPYPNRSMDQNDIDDPEFAEGDAVRWEFDGRVHGRVAGIHEQFTPPDSDQTIVGDEGEAVYSIYEWDDSLSPPRFQNTSSEPNVGKPQSSLNESSKDMPPATEENFTGDSENNMTDSDTDDDREVSTAIRGMEEDMREMKKQMDENTTMTREMHEQMMGDGGDEYAGDDGMDDDEEEDGDNEEQSTQAAELEQELNDMQERLADIREGGVTGEDVDVPGDDEGGGERDTDEQTDNHAEDGAKSLIR